MSQKSEIKKITFEFAPKKKSDPPVVKKDATVLEMAIGDDGKAGEVSDSKKMPEIVKSDDRGFDAKAMLGSMFGGGQTTNEKNIRDMYVADDNISMKTEINDVSAYSVWELVGERAEQKGYHNLAKMFRSFEKRSKCNAVSRDRTGRKEFSNIMGKRIEVADNNPDEAQGKDKILGSRGR